MIMLYGVEWTTALGHANFFGIEPWDHPALYALREGDPQDVADEAKAQGLHFSVNHPSNGDPWEYGFDHDFDSMEVWNAMYGLPPTENDLTAALWDELLMTGRRIAGRGGSDCHHQEGFEASMFNVGNPTTWVYVESATPQAVLDALRGGRATIGYSPLGERIELWADADDDGTFEAMMGDEVVDSDALQLQVRIVGARPGASYDVTVIGDGAVVEMNTLTSGTWSFSPPSPHASYYRVEVRGETPEAPPSGQGFFGGVVGLTNPIFVE
jgi:hypothetical protein